MLKREIRDMKNSTQLWGWIKNEESGKLSYLVTDDDINDDETLPNFSYTPGEVDKIISFHKLRKKEKKNLWGFLAADCDVEYEQITNFDKELWKYFLSRYRQGSFKFIANLILQERINNKLYYRQNSFSQGIPTLSFQLRLNENDHFEEKVIPQICLWRCGISFFKQLRAGNSTSAALSAKSGKM